MPLNQPDRRYPYPCSRSRFSWPCARWSRWERRSWLWRHPYVRFGATGMAVPGISNMSNDKRKRESAAERDARVPADHQAYIKMLVDAAPPLSPDQIRALTALLRPA
jgi:hypothetical protein